MKRILLSFLVVASCFVVKVNAQQISTNIDDSNTVREILHAVDTQVWQPFILALQEGDNTAYTKVHAKDVLRISNDFIGIVQGGKAYFDRNEKTFASLKERKIEAKIEFAFESRIVSKSLVSDQGYYRYTYGKAGETPKFIYGKFLVVSERKGSTWKIILDYDYTSQEDKYRISEADFQNALRKMK